MRKFLIMSALILGMAALTTTAEAKLPNQPYISEWKGANGNMYRMYGDRSIYEQVEGIWEMRVPASPGANPPTYPWTPVWN